MGQSLVYSSIIESTSRYRNIYFQHHLRNHLGMGSPFFGHLSSIWMSFKWGREGGEEIVKLENEIGLFFHFPSNGKRKGVR